MGFFTQKREIDTVSLISVSAAAALLAFFASWLYYDSKVEKLKDSYETKEKIIRKQMDSAKEKNKELESIISENEILIESCQEYIDSIE